MAEGTPPFLAALPVRPPRQAPAGALHALATHLRQRGVTDLYGAACPRSGVLSLPGVTVWTNGRVLWWRAGNNQTTWPATDAAGAARRLAGLASAPPE
jgi:hypothetical protein